MSKINGRWLKARHSNVARWIKNNKRFEESLNETNIGKTGHVYIFSIGHDNLYKIGRTKNIPDRLKSLRSANPKLSCVWSVYTVDSYNLESKLHKLMKRFLVEREIFQFDFHEQIGEINKRTNEVIEREFKKYGNNPNIPAN